MFVERNVEPLNNGSLPVKPAPRVNNPQRIEALAVEEQLLRLILELNPQVRLDVQAVVRNRRSLETDTMDTMKTVVEAAGSLSNTAEASVDESKPFVASEADYTEDANVRKLLDLLPEPPTPVNPHHRERLLRFFERYAVHRLPTVAQLLRRYQGHEQALFASLAESYGPEPTIADQDYFHEAMPPLPDGWYRCESSRGDVYYKNVITKQVSWIRPRPGSSIQ